VRTDTTDFMQKLSQHAQQTGELMEEAVRQMEMLQAETEHYKKYEPIKGWYISVKEHNRIVSRLQADCADRNRWKQIAEAQNKRIDGLEATAKGFQELCESVNQTNTAMGKKLLQMQAELEQAKAQKTVLQGIVDNEVKTISKLKSERKQAKQALVMMWFAYENKDADCPHGFETEAIQAVQGILGTWEECMPKYLGHRVRED
jgi:multidrug resistance efflux pump